MKTPRIQQVQTPIGTPVFSYLTLAQFQATHGGGWLAADGTSCVGTQYSTITGNSTTPDMRGVVPRGLNNMGTSRGTRSDGYQNPDDPTGVQSPGAIQNDAYRAHQHRTSGAAPIPGTAYGDVGSPGTNTGIPGPYAIGAYPMPLTDSGYNGGGGANETRMKNISGNWFIRVN